MSTYKSGNGQAVIKLVGRITPETQSATTIRKPSQVASSCVGSKLLLLPSGVYLTLELCAGAVNFLLDCSWRRIYIDTFTCAVYESEDETQRAFLQLCKFVESLTSIEEVEEAADVGRSAAR
ncbi:MAG: hypothetical protein WKF30_02930 [Pyrinomonadaceae bacterium]